MGKISFITGAGRGIGAEIAKAALTTGDKVVATGCNLEQLTAANAAYGEQVSSFSLDIGREQDAVAAVEVVLARFGPLRVSPLLAPESTDGGLRLLSMKLVGDDDHLASLDAGAVTGFVRQAGSPTSGRAQASRSGRRQLAQ